MVADSLISFQKRLMGASREVGQPGDCAPSEHHQNETKPGLVEAVGHGAWRAADHSCIWASRSLIALTSSSATAGS